MRNVVNAKLSKPSWIRKKLISVRNRTPLTRQPNSCRPTIVVCLHAARWKEPARARKEERVERRVEVSELNTKQILT